MEDDDLTIPSFLRIPQEERRKTWEGRTLAPADPVIPKRKIDPATEAFAAEQERVKKVRTANRLAKMIARRDAARAPTTETHYWDSLRNRWARMKLYDKGSVMEDYATMAGPDLVRLYNEMAVEAAGMGLDVTAVKKFRTRGDGVRRCAELLSRITVAKGGTPPPPPEPAAAGEVPTEELVEEDEVMRKTSGGRKAASTKTKTTRVTKKSTGSARKVAGFDPDARITLLVKENPRRPGTRAHKIYALYSECKTVGDFIARKNTSAKDLAWDVSHKNIKVG